MCLLGGKGINISGWEKQWEQDVQWNYRPGSGLIEYLLSDFVQSL